MSNNETTFALRFPEDFLFGTAASAFQSEGAYDRDGKSLSMMDHFARAYAGQFVPGVRKKGYIMTTETPDDGCFFYDNYKEYIADMKKTGQNTFRMSLAWPRLIPDGVGEVNQKAVDFYNDVINTLLENGIQPFVDIYHWDLPMELYEKGGFLSEEFPDWFEVYARVCFESFGDRVKLWSTFNEACVFITSGYVEGRFPPFIKDQRSGTLAGHHILLAHFRAVRLYRKLGQGGKIGAVNAIVPVYPATTEQADIDAARRQSEVRFDWWMQPMAEGRYPERLLAECPVYREAMPDGYAEELKSSFEPMDFIGLNYYIPSRSAFEADTPALSKRVETFYSQPGIKNDVYPAGLLDSVLYVMEKYGNMEMYITENGLCLPNTGDEEQEVNDDVRITYLREHLRMAARAVKMGANLKGYYYWCDTDAYEQLIGTSQRYGLTWIDYKTGRRRWKKSRDYYKKVIESKTVD